MKGKIRRQEILNYLTDSSSPVTASILAKLYGVSRQIIVKDIAILRNEGNDIFSGSRGYIVKINNGAEKVLKMIHSDDDVENELNIIVDNGGIIKDVFVYHKFYNIVRAEMNIRTKNDILCFLDNIKNGKSSLLKNITSGYHYHTITADTNETIEKIQSILKEKGFLAPLQEYEPDEIHNGNIGENNE